MLPRTTAKRSRADIDTSGFLIPKGGRKVGRIKPSRYENAKHVSWLHDWSCVLAGKGECDGPVVVHHLLKPWVGFRGTGRRSDDRNGLPMCDGCHRALHARGDEDAFFTEKTGFPEFGRRQAEEMWKASDYWEAVP